ncbi:MAG: RHS repeat-associated core domain-containing protein [bacterium]
MSFFYHFAWNITTEIHPVVEQDYYYYWDFKNRLTKIKKTGSGGNDSLSFSYCGMGKRIKKIHFGSDDTTCYAYDGMYAVCELGGHLDLQYNYVYANGMLLARYDASPADSHYFHHDGLGSIIGMTNESGNFERSYFYDEFGNLMADYGSVGNHYLYTGQEYDDEIANLYNLRARYYAPEIGRFISEDPMCPGMAEFPLGINPYIYVLNNPMNAIDPSGQMPIWKCKTTISPPIFEKEPRQWLTHHGQWRFSEPIGIVITPANELLPTGKVTCYFERENITETKGRVWKITPYTTVCVDECGDLPPKTVHGEQKTYLGRYTDVKEWTGSCNFSIPGDYWGKWAQRMCEDNLWKCE